MGTILSPETKSLLHPLLAQVLIALCTWLWLYITRLGAMHKQGIKPQQLADPTEAYQLLSEVNGPADNFRNLFELPVLFYIAILLTLWLGLSTPFLVACAWIFVASRALHSVIHCTYNRVMHRFLAYLLGALALWAIWIYLGLKIVSL